MTNILRVRVVVGCRVIVRVSAMMLGSALLVGGQAQAQQSNADRPVEISAQAGGVAVTGAFRGNLGSGAAAGLALQIPLSSRQFALRSDVLFQSIANYNHGCGSDEFCANVAARYQIVSGALELVARLRDSAARWSPYVIAGAAHTWETSSNSPLVPATQPNPYGFVAGVGLGWRGTSHDFFVEARYMSMSPGGVVPITIGMRF